MLSVRSNLKVVNFSNGFINLGVFFGAVEVVPQWLPCLRTIIFAVVRQHQDTAAVETLHQVRPIFVLLVSRTSICSIKHVQQLLPETEPLESLLPHSEVFFLAKELEIRQRSIHPSQTPSKSPKQAEGSN